MTTPPKAAEQSGAPMQPIVMVDGVARFKQNAVVRHLLDKGSLGLNDLAMVDFPIEDWEQFNQLIGYSVSGFGDLDEVRDETLARADAIVDEMFATPTPPQTEKDAGQGEGCDCPFCGQPAEALEIKHLKDAGDCQAECTACGARGPTVAVEEMDDAVRQWDEVARLATPPQPREQAGELVSDLRFLADQLFTEKPNVCSDAADELETLRKQLRDATIRVNQLATELEHIDTQPTIVCDKCGNTWGQNCRTDEPVRKVRRLRGPK